MKSNLNSLNVPVLNMGHARVGKEPAKLVVSYNPINLLHGQIHLTLYDKVDEERAEQPPGFIPSKRSLKTRLEHWISGTQH